MTVEQNPIGGGDNKMDFLALIKDYGGGLIQLGYVLILIFAAVKLLPELLKEHAKERENFLNTIKERDEKFFEVIQSYRDALVEFQRKEDESHRDLAAMINDCRSKVAAEHKELMRALKAVAKKMGAEIIE